MDEKNKVYKIKNEYIGEDCIQIMIPYKDSLTLLNKNMILYHYQKESPLYVNKYVSDSRNEKFPYHNIPIHFEKRNLEKYTFTNQLLNFNEPYIRITDGNITENYVVKCDDGALLLRKQLGFNKKIECKNRNELEEMFSTCDNENLYIMSLDGKMQGINDLVYPTEDEIVETVKDRMNNELASYLKTLPYTGKYFSDSTINFFKNTIDSMTIDNIKTGMDFDTSSDMIFARLDGERIKVQVVNIEFIGKNSYIVTTYDTSINDYTLEQLRILVSKISKTKNPKISLKLNKNVTQEDLNEAKKMVKTLKK